MTESPFTKDQSQVIGQRVRSGGFGRGGRFGTGFREKGKKERDGETKSGREFRVEVRQ